MSDLNAFDSLPQAPDDLWPSTVSVSATRPDAGRMSLEIPSLSERTLLDTLASGVHLNMQGAGKWAARVSLTDKGIATPREFSRLHADDAARLLAIYTAAYQAREFPSHEGLFPEALKRSASRSYVTAFQSEKRSQQKPGAAYNDDLYRQVQSQPPSQKTSVHP